MTITLATTVMPWQLQNPMFLRWRDRLRLIRYVLPLYSDEPIAVRGLVKER